jgi:hypothetical protein
VTARWPSGDSATAFTWAVALSPASRLESTPVSRSHKRALPRLSGVRASRPSALTATSCPDRLALLIVLNERDPGKSQTRSVPSQDAEARRRPSAERASPRT